MGRCGSGQKLICRMSYRLHGCFNMAKQKGTAIPRFPIVGVIGSHDKDADGRGEEVGAWLATLDVHLVTGGGTGAMLGASKGFFEHAGREGRVLGIVPCA